jgi:predicted RNA-binding Zn-ribbon protein involved in translation (DUF1610 family)
VPPTANPRITTLLHRAAAGRLACPYCQDALRATVLDATHVELQCPTCGFLEAPDLVEPARGD